MLDDRRHHALPDLAEPVEPLYAGLRMSADEYERLEDDGFRYEVVDGVVVMAPSPSADHQGVAGEIERQIQNYLIDHPIGRAFRDMDVRFDNDLVYQPDLIFVSRKRLPRRTPRIRVIPEMVLEVLSPGTRTRDQTMKRADYQRYRVEEYWMADAHRRTLTFLRLGKTGYAPVPVRAAKFASAAIPGFMLDIAAVRRAMED